ncbi:unnamed protein product [Lupinus luteus]|uniref:Uncharacterized protein n=1 Tax=Lupinus luteus TaxID=3873 RepID=A0AAV1WEP3_LUPLU
MAGNKFATMLHRNTNSMVVILVYAVLEWVLILLLLFNSLFSYLMTKLAESVGLKPPCFWCSRVDHVLQPGKSTNLYKDLLCETHGRVMKMHPDLPTLFVNESFLGDENFTSKGSRIVESIDDEKEGDREKNEKEHDHEDEGIRDEHQTFSDIESFILREVVEDRSSSFSNLHSDGKDAEKEDKEDDLIITELDPSDEDLMENEQKIQTFASESPVEAQLSILEEASLLTMDNNIEKTSMREIESLPNFIVFDFEELKQNSLLEEEEEVLQLAAREEVLQQHHQQEVPELALAPPAQAPTQLEQEVAQLAMATPTEIEQLNTESQSSIWDNKDKKWRA